jgi:hypothetical protein
MSLHITYNVKERRRPIPCFTRFLTSVLSKVGGERFARISTPKCLDRAVVSSSATGAAYGPLRTSRQQLFCRFSANRMASRTWQNSRHRNDCLPTFRVGQATVAVAVAINAEPRFVVGRERSSIGGCPGAQAVFCSFAKFYVASLDYSFRPSAISVVPAGRQPGESRSGSGGRRRSQARISC